MAWISVTFARPGHGKSLDAARTIVDLFPQYYRTEKKFPKLPKRQLLCNMKLSTAIEKKELGKHLFYWDKFDQLRFCERDDCFKGSDRHGIHDVDLVVDELPDYCPADGWRDLPRWARKMFSQHRHRGIRIFAITQDYMAIDINFRRMVGAAFEVQKIMGSRDISATLPPVKKVWGVIMKRKFDPRELEEVGTTGDLTRVGMPQFFFIRRRLVETYDTTQDLPEWRPASLEHLEFNCLDPKCRLHPKGQGHVEHRKI